MPDVRRHATRAISSSLQDSGVLSGLHDPLFWLTRHGLKGKIAGGSLPCGRLRLSASTQGWQLILKMLREASRRTLQLTER